MQNAFSNRVPRKYSRALDWALVRGTIHEAGAMMILSETEIPDILEDYLDISRRRRTNRAAIMQLQMHLVQDLEEQQRTNKYFKEELSKAQATKDAKQIGDAEVALLTSRLFGNALRGIGDGIVWRAMNYDRAVLQVLSRASTKQNVIADGTAAELRVWAEQSKLSKDAIPLLNALSNWLAMGDVTVVHGDGGIDLLEVKAGNSRSPRITRQKDRLKETVTLLKEGRGTLEGVPIEFRMTDIFPENGLYELDRLLTAAGVSGWAAARLSNCTYVECVDYSKNTGEGWYDQINERREHELRDWTERGDFVNSMDSADLLSFSPNCAPLSIFPFKARTCIDLLLGRKIYRVYQNVDAICREFEFRHWKVLKSATELQAEGRLENAFAVIEKGALRIDLPGPFLMRMQMETIRPQVFVRLCDLIFEAGPGAMKKIGHSFGHTYVFNDENRIWD